MDVERKTYKEMRLNTETGSLMNHMMSNSSKQPKVGEGATVLGWTDRKAYEVISVSKDCKEVVLQRYSPRRADDRGMTDAQEYIYDTLIESYLTLRFRYGRWYAKYGGDDGEKPVYDRIHVIFGEKMEYYDFSF